MNRDNIPNEIIPSGALEQLVEAVANVINQIDWEGAIAMYCEKAREQPSDFDLLQAADRLQLHCETHSCGKCIFEKGDGCKLWKLPYEWQLGNEVQKLRKEMTEHEGDNNNCDHLCDTGRHFMDQ